jgi:FixJ family two-component response regulator
MSPDIAAPYSAFGQDRAVARLLERRAVSNGTLDDRAGAVAIVDDDPAVRDSLKFLLEVAGHTVAVYDSAAQFLADSGSSPACLIVDQHMPDMTGLELAARMRSERSPMPMMLITGAPSPAISARAAQLGVERVLEKPPGEDDLLRFVAAHC